MNLQINQGRMLIFYVILYIVFVFGTGSLLFSISDVAESKVKYVILCSLLFSCSLYYWSYNIKHVVTYFFFWLYSISISYIPIMIGDGYSSYHLYSSTINTCTAILSLFTFSFMGFVKIKINSIRFIIQFIVGIFLFLYLMVSTIFYFYWGISGKEIRTDILLTLVQTNTSESLSYLKSLPMISLVIAILFFICIIAVIIYFIKKSFKNLYRTIPIWGLLIMISLSVLVLINSGKIYRPYTLLVEFKESIQQYKDFHKNREARLEKLTKISPIQKENTFDGVYILVIGESETRDHMSVYGYERNTTPWLKEMANVDSTIVFNNAYSNHTHTVPNLLYALTEKNQYNTIDLKDAYSITEVTKATYIPTYWISNQVRYGAWDTPIAEIADVADYQKWINGTAGETSTSTNYDGALINEIPELSHIQRGLVIFHLMGSHLTYKDRYPQTYSQFSGNNNLDTYDNSIYYNDYVLHSIYDVASRNSNFKAMVIMSDHGEDIEPGKAHEASKFTPVMSKIPFIVLLSPSYKAEHPDIYNQLVKHKNSYWGNDLLYNFMTSLMGIDNLPYIENNLDLIHPSYDRTKNNLKTLHGQIAIPE